MRRMGFKHNSTHKRWSAALLMELHYGSRAEWMQFYVNCTHKKNPSINREHKASFLLTLTSQQRNIMTKE